MIRVSSFTALSMALLGCAASGTHPEDMSAAQHANVAEQEERRATEHRAELDPNARQAGLECGPSEAAGTPGPGGACWTSITNPTDEHKRQMARHRDLAAQHRAASDELRRAEARACSGLSDDDRDMSPFAHREDIASAEPLKQIEVPYGGIDRPEATVGATVVFRAKQGMTAEWLQRLVDCHVARAASVGFQMPEMGYCPLALKGVSATVRSARGGFAVEMRAGDADEAREILRRAQALVPRAAGAQQ